MTQRVANQIASSKMRGHLTVRIVRRENRSEGLLTASVQVRTP